MREKKPGFFLKTRFLTSFLAEGRDKKPGSSCDVPIAKNPVPCIALDVPEPSRGVVKGCLCTNGTNGTYGTNGTARTAWRGQFDSLSYVASSSGATRALLLLAEAGSICITISEQVVTETERAVARKVSQALPYYRQALRATSLRIVRDPSPEEVAFHADIISHAADVPIVVAAMNAQVDYLVTFNRRHFIDDASVAARSGLRIGTPAEGLAWVRERLNRAD